MCCSCLQKKSSFKIGCKHGSECIVALCKIFDHMYTVKTVPFLKVRARQVY